MKLTAFFLFLVLIAASAQAAFAQNSNAAQTAADLRNQLNDVQAKQTELKGRLQQLDEDIKPENIERSLAGIGSTKPEELREQRRKQLSIERASVQNQIEALAARQARLEAAIQKADNLAYQESAQGTQLNTMGFAGVFTGSRLRLVAVVGLLAILGIAGVTTLLRRQNKI
jgi:hypothetical protein